MAFLAARTIRGGLSDFYGCHATGDADRRRDDKNSAKSVRTKHGIVTLLDSRILDWVQSVALIDPELARRISFVTARQT